MKWLQQRGKARKTYQTVTDWLIQQSTTCQEDCALPEGIRIGIGGLPGNSFSPWYGRVQLHSFVCGRSVESVYIHLLHELGHARRRFSRVRYTLSRSLLNPWRKSQNAFWIQEEQVADAFAQRFAACCVSPSQLRAFLAAGQDGDSQDTHFS